MASHVVFLVDAPLDRARRACAAAFASSEWLDADAKEGELVVRDAGLSTVLEVADDATLCAMFTLFEIAGPPTPVELSRHASARVTSVTRQSTAGSLAIVVADEGRLLRRHEVSTIDGPVTHHDVGALADWDDRLVEMGAEAAAEDLLDGRIHGPVVAKLRLAGHIAPLPDRVHVHGDRLLLVSGGVTTPLFRRDVVSGFRNPVAGRLEWLVLADGRKLPLPAGTDAARLQGFLQS